jgi:pyruvate-formate lyase-activating enzyme
VNEQDTIDRGWFYVDETPIPPGARAARTIHTKDKRVLSRRLHGFPGHIRVFDRSGQGLPRATLLRAAAAVGHGIEAGGHPKDARVDIVLATAGTTPSVKNDPGGVLVFTVDGPSMAAAPSAHAVQDLFTAMLTMVMPPVLPLAQNTSTPPCHRVLFFESLMNTDMPHNDGEISQGVLHMASRLRELDIEVVLANVKMAITGDDRSVLHLESLDQALKGGPIGLVCITLLEGYFEGVVRLIEALRSRGCRAAIAVGGVMPTLAPEHVMAHLPGVSFVCRGAGETHLKQLVELASSAGVDHVYTPAQLAAWTTPGRLSFVQSTAGPVLVANRCDLSPSVGDLDRVDLNLGLVAPRHIVGGIEISTSRGCVHRCSFCSIMGREKYQARSVGGVFDVLTEYDAHFKQLFPDKVPENAYRVHICDDDFACDRERAKSFFERLPTSKFRLSSVQVSIADLCVRRDGRLLAEADEPLLNAITPACFADAGLPVPATDFVTDHRSRRWSSFLAIGVETFSEKELVRLGKGYQVAHIRVIVDALSRRGLHMDAYFIQSNSATSADDLIDCLDELCRLKMAHPKWFHVRFPIVPRLVSYFTSASHRRIVRQGRRHVLKIEKWAQVPNHPEYDYPFVSHDIAEDKWVEHAVSKNFFTDVDLYTGSLTELHAVWTQRIATLPPGPERHQGERLVRRLDDRQRRVTFRLLADARRAAKQRGERPPGVPSEAVAFAATEHILGPSERWLNAFQRFDSNEVPRLTVIPTWECELRCRYCFIPKQSGRVMDTETMERAIDMLLASDRVALMLQFFGGEALLEYPLLQHAMRYGTKQAKRLNKELSFVISTNGWSIDAERLRWLADYPVRLELSLDGDADTQNRFRRALTRGADSYAQGIPEKMEMIAASGIPHEVIMVVHPEAVSDMPDNFFHIAGLGYQRIQINFALGYLWTEPQKQCFANGLHQIGGRLREHWASGETLEMTNLHGPPMPIRLNGEITVDWDGTIYGGNAFLHETPHKANFVIGKLDDLGSFERYWMDAPANEYLLEWSYPPDVTQNNLSIGRIMASFTRWMQGSEPARAQP